MVTELKGAYPVAFAYIDIGGLVAGDTEGVTAAATVLEGEEMTGHIVVYNEMTSVVIDPILPGQSVIVAAQDVIVYTDVV